MSRLAHDDVPILKAFCLSHKICDQNKSSGSDIQHSAMSRRPKQNTKAAPADAGTGADGKKGGHSFETKEDKEDAKWARQFFGSESDEDEMQGS